MRRAITSGLTMVALSACSFGFKGGGLPPDVRTAAVLPFENETADPTIGQAVMLSVREAVERRLGLRSAGENQADVIVRGKITRYDPDLPIAYNGVPGAAGTADTVKVTQRLLSMSVSVEMIERTTLKVIYSNPIAVDGTYDPGRESDGRRRALDKLVTKIVEGAQSKW